MELDKNYFLAYKELGFVYYVLKEEFKALEYLLKVESINPNYKEIFYLKGLNYYSLKNFEIFTETEFYSFECYLYMGIIYNSKRDFRKSNFFYHKYLGLKPETDFIYYNKGLNFLELKDYKNSLDSFDKCLFINKNYFGCFYNKAKFFLELGNEKEALKNLDKFLLFEKKDFKIWFIRGMILKNFGEDILALESFDKVLEINKENFQSYQEKLIFILN